MSEAIDVVVSGLVRFPMDIEEECHQEHELHPVTARASCFFFSTKGGSVGASMTQLVVVVVDKQKSE